MSVLLPEQLKQKMTPYMKLQALDLYSANLTKGTPIQTYTISNDCSNLAEVWQLEPYSLCINILQFHETEDFLPFFISAPYYIFRSVLGGSTSWKHSMTTNGTLPYLNEGTNQDSYWHVEPVSGTNYWNIYSNRYNSSGRSSLRNTGYSWLQSLYVCFLLNLGLSVSYLQN